MSRFYSWPDIQNAHNLRRSVVQFSEILKSNLAVTYRAKPKIDGTNAAIQIHPDGTLLCQSRTRIINVNDDNFGFAKFVDSEKEYWQSLAKKDQISCIYGELAGDGVQSDLVISQVPWKNFLVFAIMMIRTGEDVNNAKFIIEPQEIYNFLYQNHDYFGWKTDKEFNNYKFSISKFVHVLPWCSKSFNVEWLSTPEKIQDQLLETNNQVKEIGNSDFFVKECFGIEGQGEGVVCYPTSHTGRENFLNLAFKAKVDKLQVSKTALPAQATVGRHLGLMEFLKNVVTQPRLEQGVRQVSAGELTFDLKKIGQFLSWIANDVKKECQAELSVLNLDWSIVEREVKTHSRKWFLEEVNKIS